MVLGGDRALQRGVCGAENLAAFAPSGPCPALLHALIETRPRVSSEMDQGGHGIGVHRIAHGFAGFLFKAGENASAPFQAPALL